MDIGIVPRHSLTEKTLVDHYLKRDFLLGAFPNPTLTKHPGLGRNPDHPHAHMESTRTGQPAVSTHSDQMAKFDLEAQKSERPQKRTLKTNASYAAEWREGSKMRVIKYLLAHIGIGILVGAIVGVIIGLSLRYG